MNWGKRRPGKRSGRFLLLALPLLAILAGGVVYRYGYLRVQSELSDLKEAQARKMDLLRKEITLISRSAQLEQEERALAEERKAEEARFIDGATAPLAAAAMQQLVKDLVVKKGGAVLAENVEKPENEGALTVVSETLDSTYPDIRVFLDAVSALETQASCLSLREIDVRVKNPADPRDLTVRMKISALSKGT